MRTLNNCWKCVVFHPLQFFLFVWLIYTLFLCCKVVWSPQGSFQLFFTSHTWHIFFWNIFIDASLMVLLQLVIEAKYRRSLWVFYRTFFRTLHHNAWCPPTDVFKGSLHQPNSLVNKCSRRTTCLAQESGIAQNNFLCILKGDQD